MDKLISKRETPLQDWMGSLINSIANFTCFTRLSNYLGMFPG